MTIYNVTNRETREHAQDRYITYDLQVPLPDGWDSMSTDEQGYWLNENAEFISDEFAEPTWGDMDEETIDIEEDELQGDL
jgi:hypothetical protein